MKANWTKERIKELSVHFKTRSQFKLAHNYAYRIAQRDGYLDELFCVINGSRQPIVNPRKWTYQNLKQVANKYDYRSDFKENDNSAYESARRHKMLDLLFEDKPNKGYKNKRHSTIITSSQTAESKKFWTKEKVIEEGLKFNTRLEFKKAYKTAYNYALLGGYMDEIFKDKPNLGYKSSILAKANNDISITGHRRYWTEERIIKIAVHWNGPLSHLNKKYPGFTKYIERYGLQSKVKQARINYFKSIPKEKIEAEARKCNRRNFRKHSYKMYYAAYYQNLLDELFSKGSQINQAPIINK